MSTRDNALVATRCTPELVAKLDELASAFTIMSPLGRRVTRSDVACRR